MAVSDNTLKILMRIAYLDASPAINRKALDAGGLTFAEMYASIMSWPINALESQALFSRRLNTRLEMHPELLRLTFLGQITDRTGGFSAAAFQDIDGERILAFRGTNAPLDLVDNWMMSLKKSDRQKLEAILFFDIFGQPSGEPIHLIGHSMGGGLVAFLFMLIADERLDVVAHVLNAAYFPGPDTDGLIDRLGDARFMSEGDANDGLHRFYHLAAQSSPQWRAIYEIHKQYMRKSVYDSGARNLLRGHMVIPCDI